MEPGATPIRGRPVRTCRLTPVRFAAFHWQDGTSFRRRPFFQTCFPFVRRTGSRQWRSGRGKWRRYRHRAAGGHRADSFLATLFDISFDGGEQHATILAVGDGRCGP